MVGNPQAYGLALGMQHPSRQFLRSFENKGIAARRRRLEQPVLDVVYPGVLGNFRKVTDHQGQVVTVIDLANFANAIDCRLVAQMAPRA